MSKEYVLLIDGKPSRYYKDGQIKTYQTRENAEKQAVIHARNMRKRNEYWETRDRPDLVSAIPTYSVGKFAAIEVEEVDA